VMLLQRFPVFLSTCLVFGESRFLYKYILWLENCTVFQEIWFKRICEYLEKNL
jgi:hypothetical protein